MYTNYEINIDPYMNFFNPFKPYNTGKDPISSMQFQPNLCGHKHDERFSGFPMRIIGDFEIIYFVGGKGFVTIKDAHFECERGDVIFICPYEKHMLSSDMYRPQNNYWVHFDVNPSYMSSLLTDFFSSENITKIHIGYDSYIEELFKNILFEMENKKEGYLSLAGSYLSIALINILRTAGISIIENGRIEALNHDYVSIKHIENAEKYIRDNYKEKITIDDICRHLFISESYLHKLFKSYLKTSPAKYITKLRMEHAIYLIINHDMSLSEIAASVGYPNIYHFSNAFKKNYGCSPSKYLEKLNY